jgi:hypothetical protein
VFSDGFKQVGSLKVRFASLPLSKNRPTAVIPVQAAILARGKAVFCCPNVSARRKDSRLRGNDGGVCFQTASEGFGKGLQIKKAV